MNSLTTDDPRLIQVLRDEAACKARKTCARLEVRQLYFEPNHLSLSSWQERGSFVEPLDPRVVFVCESPSERKAPGDGPEFAVDGQPIWTCWQYFTHQDRRFHSMRARHGFQNCMITNAVKCGKARPLEGFKPDIQEASACAAFLRREVEIIQPRVLACMGEKAYSIVKEHVVRELPRFVLAVQLTHYSGRLSEAAFQARWDDELREVHNYLRGDYL